MKRNRFFRIGGSIFATLLTLSCYFSETRPEPSVEPYVPPVTDVSPTNTPLPPLTDFEEVLTFGGGGGGEPGCIVDPGYRPAITVEQDWRIIYNYVDLCLWGVISSGLSFRLELISPDGKIFRSNGLSVEQNTLEVQWEGYQGFEGYFDQRQNVAGLFISWPNDLLSGKWHANAYVGDFQTVADLSIVREDQPSISALDLRAGTEIIPVTFQNNLPFHPLGLKNNGNVDVFGMHYPANALIYVLLYQETSSLEPTLEFTLIHKQSVLSDSNGSITTELSGPFEVDQSYLIIGISDPNISIVASSVGNHFDVSLPHDLFRVMPSTTASNASNSCPGAPLQRMIVNKSGHVCTQNNSIRMRSGPARSASTLFQLKPDTYFTVIGGPACSDNWSWWNIRMRDGTTGWVSEGGDEVDQYFICPMP